MKEKLEKRERNIITILGIAILFVIIILISNIVGTRTSLDKIIYNAKVEAENTLISNGTLTYTKDVWAISNRPHNTVLLNKKNEFKM